MSAEESHRKSPLIWVFYLLTALAAGAAIPSQGRVNAELVTVVQDPVLTTLLSFLSGLIIMALAVPLSPRGRRAMKKVIPSIRSGEVKAWYLFAGFIGAYFVLTQSLAMGAVGIAVFSVAVVTGQTVGGLLWDRIGLGPAGRKRISAMRGFGAVLTVAAVLWTVSPQLSTTDRGILWLLLVLLPFSGGFLQAAQQALNGRQLAAYGNSLPGTLFNFATGTAVLAVAWLIKIAIDGIGEPLPTTWWYYLGGPFGIVFIALGAYLVSRVGVLLAAMGMIAGQLLGSLLLDVLFPAPGSLITAATVLGTVLTLLAVGVASLPDVLGRGHGRPPRRSDNV